MQVKTSELIGEQLDWAVAMCEGKQTDCSYLGGNIWYGSPMYGLVIHCPSTKWEQAGPIIEREYIDIEYFPGDCVWQAQACLQDEYCTQHGPTPLIAAMRCFVASKLGDTVELPEGLT